MSQKHQDHQAEQSGQLVSPNLDTQAGGPIQQTASPAESLQRVQNTPPSTARPGDILKLQRTIGNQAVQRLVDTSPGTVQRHPHEEQNAQARALAGQLGGQMEPLAGNLNSVSQGNRDQRSSLDSASTQWEGARGTYQQMASLTDQLGGQMEPLAGNLNSVSQGNRDQRTSLDSASTQWEGARGTFQQLESALSSGGGGGGQTAQAPTGGGGGGQTAQAPTGGGGSSTTTPHPGTQELD